MVATLSIGCAEGDAGGAGEREAVELVKHTYYPRHESEDYWETVDLSEAGGTFLLFVQPRIRTPAEGPWTAVFVDPEGRQRSRFTGLKVDVATGRFTFLCSSSDFAPGDWIIQLSVEEGGLVSGERERTFRFRVVE